MKYQYLLKKKKSQLYIIIFYEYNTIFIQYFQETLLKGRIPSLVF